MIGIHLYLYKIIKLSIFNELTFLNFFCLLKKKS